MKHEPNGFISEKRIGILGIKKQGNSSVDMVKPKSMTSFYLNECFQWPNKCVYQNILMTKVQVVILVLKDHWECQNQGDHRIKRNSLTYIHKTSWFI